MNYKCFILKSLLFLLLIVINSCENDIEKIKSFSNEEVYPTILGKDFEILKSDSGNINIKVIASKILYYSDIDEPYIEFTEGITVYFYDLGQEPESEINADYAIYYELQKLWMAKNNVEAINLKTDEHLFTEQLFWDEENGLIYSESFTKITNEEGVFFGQKGFESNQNFTKWKLKGSKGTVNIKDE